jgi:hypothetical protein
MVCMLNHTPSVPNYLSVLKWRSYTSFLIWVISILHLYVCQFAKQLKISHSYWSPTSICSSSIALGMDKRLIRQDVRTIVTHLPIRVTYKETVMLCKLLSAMLHHSKLIKQGCSQRLLRQESWDNRPCIPFVCTSWIQSSNTCVLCKASTVLWPKTHRKCMQTVSLVQL